MNKLECPHCHQQAMTPFGKACLGPARSVPCAACGERVSVSWYSMVGLPFLLGGMVMAMNLSTESLFASGLIFTAGFVVLLFIHLKLSPLVKRS